VEGPACEISEIQGRVLRVAGKHASMPRGSGGKLGRPRRPTPKGGGAGLAGVRALVQR
jgi:hypothetical protein